MANINIRLGYKTSSWFDDNPTVVLREGQVVYLEQTGNYKIGDGVTQLSNLVFLGANTTSVSTTFVLTGLASDISGYIQAVPLSSYSVGGIYTKQVTGIGLTPVLLEEFATNSGAPNRTVIPEGLFTFTYQTRKDSGNREYYTYVQVYKRNLTGTETLIVTSSNSGSTTTNNIVDTNVSAFVSTNILLLNTDRIVIKIYAVVLTGTATIDLLTDDNTNSNFSMPISVYTSATLQSAFNNGSTITNMPTSPSGLPVGSLWNDSGTVKIV